MGTTRTSRGGGNLDSIAPLDPPAGADRPSSTSGNNENPTTVVTITWYAVLDAMDDANANNGDQP
jgi:hypothetical protein